MEREIAWKKSTRLGYIAKHVYLVGRRVPKLQFYLQEYFILYGCTMRSIVHLYSHTH